MLAEETTPVPPPTPDANEPVTETLAPDSTEEPQLDPAALQEFALAQLAQTQDQLLRLTAEFENYKRRTARERSESFAQASADVLRAILPVWDNLARAANATNATPEDLAQGQTMIFEQLSAVFAAQGAERFGAPGDAFDPAIHTAVAQNESSLHHPGEVVEVLEPGWRLREKLLRPAMVTVAS